MPTDNNEFTLAVAVQNDPSCHQAVEYALDLARNLKSFKLYFIYVVSKMPTSKFPVFNQLDKSLNVEAHEEGKKDMKDILLYLDQTTAGIPYEFVKLEKDKDIGDILFEFVETTRPNLFIVGTHGSQSSLKKFVIGSTSQFCLDHLPCPVALIKPKESE